MPGHAVFSNINDIIYGKAGQAYDRAVKRFGTLLKKQKIIPTVRAGYIKNFTESEIITEEEIKRVFRLSFTVSDYHFAEITIFTWE